MCDLAGLLLVVSLQGLTLLNQPSCRLSWATEENYQFSPRVKHVDPFRNVIPMFNGSKPSIIIANLRYLAQKNVC
jgi:hypothetical protein